MMNTLRISTGFAQLVSNLKEFCEVIYREKDVDHPGYLIVAYGKYIVVVEPLNGHLVYKNNNNKLEAIMTGALRRAFVEIISDYARKWEVMFDVDNPIILKGDDSAT